MPQITQGGGTCVTNHRVTSVQNGPGKCCAALAASGQAAAVGVRVAAKTSTGKCFVCEITTSRSAKRAGALVFKRGKSMGLCPSTSEGCCALTMA